MTKSGSSQRKEGINTRKFTCPYCGFIRVLSGRELRKFRKRLSGFTCGKCGEKVSPYELSKKRGKGPKPPGERRKRVKKEVVKEKPKAVVPQPYVEQFEWRNSGPPPPGEPWIRAGWRPKPRQPTGRTLEEAIVEAFLSKPKKRRRK